MAKGCECVSIANTHSIAFEISHATLGILFYERMPPAVACSMNYEPRLQPHQSLPEKLQKLCYSRCKERGRLINRRTSSSNSYSVEPDSILFESLHQFQMPRNHIRVHLLTKTPEPSLPRQTAGVLTIPDLTLSIPPCGRHIARTEMVRVN